MRITSLQRTALAAGLTAWTAAVGLLALVIAAGAQEAPGLVLDRLTAVLLVLIVGVSAVIAVFSTRYLQDDPRLGRFLALLALTQGPRVHNAVVRVQLRSNDDLLMTAVGHTMALIPGSLVVEVVRACGVLYFHVLDVAGEDQAESFRASTLRTEATWIRILGSRAALAELGREARGDDTTSSGALHSPTTRMQRVLAARERNRRDETGR